MIDTIKSVECVRQEIINGIYKKIYNDLPINQNIYKRYFDLIDSQIELCIKNGCIQFSLPGDGPCGKLPGMIEALLLLKGYGIEKGENENEYLINIFNRDNYK
jgi:hypothetical protein